MSDELMAAAFTPDELAEASRYRLEIEWSDEDGAFLVTLPELEGIRSHAPTPAEAAERGVELAAEYLGAMRTLGRPVSASAGAGERPVKWAKAIERASSVHCIGSRLLDARAAIR